MAKNEDAGLYRRGKRGRYWLRFSVAGKKVRVPLISRGEHLATRNLSTARLLKKRILRQHREVAPIPETIEDTIAEFQRVNARRSPKQAKVNVSVAQRFLKHGDITDPLQITVATIDSYLNSLTEQGRSAKTVMNQCASISRFCRFLVSRDMLDENPCRQIETPRPEVAIPRFLDEEEVQRALALAEQHGIYAEVATALYTGLRREELRRLAWDDVRFVQKTIIVPKSKSRRPRSIPLHSELEKILKKHPRAGAYVFPGRQRKGESGMRKAQWWSDALKPLQKAIPKFAELPKHSTGRGWHLFRHTFASRAAQAGVPIYKVSKWLGHKDVRTTMIYAHLAPGHDADIDKV